ncbi:MAG: hypothetical protein VX874_11630 [Pseudomonadota bacterium]|nr:hypothetical protein [Pseudomonadota bacterium]
MQIVRRYKAVHGILKVFEILGWGTAGIGVLFALIGFSEGDFPLLTPVPDPSFWDRAIAAIPGLLFVQAGLAAIALSKVGAANIDTAEMTYELLELTRKSSTSISAPPKPADALTKPRVVTPVVRANRMEEGQEDDPKGTFVSYHNGTSIFLRATGYFVGETRFPDLASAKAHIDKG